ncbi:MAG: flagellar biosynthesis anti-sigma factor FlgM [Pseudomonadota bacterium]
MNTKIDGVSPGQVSQSVGQTPDNTVRNARQDTPAQTQGADTDNTRVDITSNAALLGRLDQALANVPDVDAQRVESVKTAIAEGSYQIDADQIAEALIKLDDDIDPLA